MIAGKRQMLSDATRGSARRPYTYMSDICARRMSPELSDAWYMAQLRIELKYAANLSDDEIAAYTEDEQAWLAYKADGYSPLGSGRSRYGALELSRAASPSPAP